MNDVVKSIGKYFARDFLYFLGGTCVIVCFLYLKGIVPRREFKNYELFFIVSIGYVVGYLNQEFGSIIHITTTQRPKEKICLIYKWIFKRFTGRDFDESILKRTEQINFHDVPRESKRYDEFQRIIFHKQVGTTMSSNLLICSIILMLKFYFPIHFKRDELTLPLLIACIFMSIVLIAVAWIKLLQQAELIEKVRQETESVTK